jgi:hypothetical protein
MILRSSADHVKQTPELRHSILASIYIRLGAPGGFDTPEKWMLA